MSSAKIDYFDPDEIKLLLEGIKDYAIYMLDTEGHVASWNTGAATIKGYSAEEILGCHFSCFYTVEDIDWGKPDYDLQVAASMGRYEEQGWRVRKDGSRFWAEVVITALRDDTGKLRGFGKVIRDITERKQAEEALRQSEERFRVIFEQAAVGIAHVALDGRWLRVNQKLCDIVGYTQAELLERTFRDITYPADRDVDFDCIQQMLAGETQMFSLEKRYVCKDDSLVWVNVTISLVREPSGEPKYFIGIAEDISQRKRAESEILYLNTKLEQRVAARTAELTAVNKELEAFAYSVSHDLRAPLRHIDGFIGLLRTRADSALDSQAHRYLDIIGEAAKKMGALIDDLLAFSRMSRAELVRRPVDMEQLVMEVIQTLECEARARSIIWSIGTMPEVEADRTMLGIVFVNLLGNAVKFTGRREQPRIAVGCLMDQPDEVVFFVRDNGAGFDMRYADKLFGVFQRLHRADEFEGTGIGLANVKRIIHRHGGRVWAEGQVDAGATFYFSLPVPRG